MFDRGLGDLFVTRTAGHVLDNAVRANVALTVQHLKVSLILSEAIESGKLKIVGGRYDLDTGSVEIVG